MCHFDRTFRLKIGQEAAEGQQLRNVFPRAAGQFRMRIKCYQQHLLGHWFKDAKKCHLPAVVAFLVVINP